MQKSPVGSVEVALRHTAQLLEQDPRLAATQAAEILLVAPDHPLARLYLGAARRALGETSAALAVLEPLAAAQAPWAAAQYQLGLALAQAERGDAALAALCRAV